MKYSALLLVRVIQFGGRGMKCKANKQVSLVKVLAPNEGICGFKHDYHRCAESTDYGTVLRGQFDLQHRAIWGASLKSGDRLNEVNQPCSSLLFIT